MIVCQKESIVINYNKTSDGRLIPREGKMSTEFCPESDFKKIGDMVALAWKNIDWEKCSPNKDGIISCVYGFSKKHGIAVEFKGLNEKTGGYTKFFPIFKKGGSCWMVCVFST